MKRKWSVILILAVAVVLGSLTVAHAKMGEGGRSDRPHHKQDEARMRERIELIKMWKLTEVLDLDQETASKLFPLMHEFDVKQQELREKRGETFRQMREELEKDAPDTSALRPLIDDFTKNERKMVELRIEQLDKLSKVLSDDQIAKMIVLIPKFERNVRELMGEARAMRKEHRRMMKQREHMSPEDRQRPPMFDQD